MTIREYLARLWFGDVCKMCGERMARHRPVRHEITVSSTHVDRDVHYSTYECPQKEER